MRDLYSCQPKEVAAEFLRDFEKLLHRIDLDSLERVYWALKSARKRGAMIYIAGNGGSASTASHWVNDLGKGTKAAGGLPMRALSLSDNISWLTALANDESYERVFSGQLENFAQAGDILIVISASGNSPNLLRAVEMARRHEVLVIGLLGFDGGALKTMVDECLLLPTSKGAYGLVESGHALLCHILTACLAADRAEREVSSPRVRALA
ncbi:MAG TPA: SIS domain-containing protein [Terriglobales bacterium]|jgi:D-sedoheptulose 7-phosphate isomerase|nr:SIS domain-containing protein [Terriglobales bacterium]